MSIFSENNKSYVKAETECLMIKNCKIAKLFYVAKYLQFVARIKCLGQIIIKTLINSSKKMLVLIEFC